MCVGPLVTAAFCGSDIDGSVKLTMTKSFGGGLLYRFDWKLGGPYIGTVTKPGCWLPVLYNKMNSKELLKYFLYSL